MKIDFIDLKAQQKLIKDKVDQRIQAVLTHGQYIMGPEVKECEEKLAEFTGAKHCIAYSSGTDALLAAMMALDLNEGDEVIVPGFTFYATVGVMPFLKVKPILVDVRTDDYNIDVTKIEAAITPKTKAIMPVSLYGQCADMKTINEIAQKHNLFVVEDAAQSFGASQGGEKSCSMTDIACTSFFPAKPLGCYGDGGACFTNNDEWARKLNMIRLHGSEQRYNHQIVGMNGRFDTIQAAILIEKLAIFSKECEDRESIGRKYNEMFLAAGLERVAPPVIQKANTHVFAQYTIQVANRDKVRTSLSELGVPTAVHYPRALNDQEVFKKVWPECGADIPNSQKLANSVISLPMHPYLKEEEQKFVVDSVKKVLE